MGSADTKKLRKGFLPFLTSKGEGSMSIVALQDTFLQSYSRIPKSEQKRIYRIIDALQDQRNSKGLNLERLKTLDPHVYSVRLSHSYRIILVRPENEDVYLLVWVDHHDAAYKWAERKRFIPNPKTRTLQMWDLEQWNVEKMQEKAPSPEQPALFAHVTDEQLLELGVIQDYIPIIRNIYTREDFKIYKPIFPKDTAEYLEFIAQGDDPETVLEVMRELAQESQISEKADTITYVEAITSPTSSRSILVAAIDGAVHEQLREALEQPLDKWRVFLHPRQKAVVEKNYRGPVRVLGGAGTGKTVVAMHRARYLIRNIWKDTNDRILVTTFTQTLANNLQEVLSTMCSKEEMARIDVIHIDALARRIVEKAKRRNIYIISEKKVKELWNQALEQHNWDKSSLSFLRSEYDWAVGLNGIETWEEYMVKPRVGRKKALSRKERKRVWDTIFYVMEQKRKNHWYEFTDVLREARKWLEENPDQPFFRYRAAVVDEAQDFHQEGFKLLRALISPGDNDLFIVGDAHQRIYPRQVVLSHCGINVRGRRSMRLNINYRTTEEIRQKAVEVIQQIPFDDLDGGADQGKDISLLSGDLPVIRSFPTSQDEKKFVIWEIQKLLKDGVLPHEIAVLAPTKHGLDQMMKRLYEAEIPAEKLGTQVQSKIQCGTIHSSKGLEFRVVFIIEANEDELPNSWLVEQKKDDSAELENYLRSQRSLLYVAMTRAREQVYVTAYGELTPFLKQVEKTN